MAVEPGTKHLYLSAIVVVLLGVLITAVGSVFQRINKAEEQAKIRIDKIEQTMLNREFLDQKFKYYDFRLDKMEEQCCSDIPEKEWRQGLHEFR
jgi:FlaG/FlaF family flagellin (archaellin)